MKITDDIKYIGVNDHDVDLFEGQYVVPLGMAYNSYLVKDEKIAVMDTVDRNFGDAWLANLKAEVGAAAVDYLVVHHMEPDHSANDGGGGRTVNGSARGGGRGGVSRMNERNAPRARRNARARRLEPMGARRGRATRP